MTEDKMLGWHHRLNGHEFEQVLGDGEGQGGLACCSPWGRTKSRTWLNGITDLMDMSLNKFWEIVKDRQAWCAPVHGIVKSQG